MYRIKQFIKSVLARLDYEDENFINDYLDSSEKKLLYKLPVADIKHSINVARDILNDISLQKSYENDIDIIIKCALLHDIGKQINPLNPVEKSILVILNSITKGKIKNYENKNKKIYIYYNHGYEGYNLLDKKKYSKEFLDTIRYHHNYKIKSKYLDLLREYDDKN